MGWSLGHRRHYHLTSVLSLTKNRTFCRIGLGSLDLTPLFLVAAVTPAVGGGGQCTQPPWHPFSEGRY